MRSRKHCGADAFSIGEKEGRVEASPSRFGDETAVTISLRNVIWRYNKYLRVESAAQMFFI